MLLMNMTIYTERLLASERNVCPSCRFGTLLTTDQHPVGLDTADNCIHSLSLQMHRPQKLRQWRHLNFPRQCLTDRVDRAVLEDRNDGTEDQSVPWQDLVAACYCTAPGMSSTSKPKMVAVEGDSNPAVGDGTVLHPGTENYDDTDDGKQQMAH